jgi:hypothetical protein
LFLSAPAALQSRAWAHARKLFRHNINVFATLVLELKYLNAAQYALCDATTPAANAEMPATQASAIHVGRIGSGDWRGGNVTS